MESKMTNEKSSKTEVFMACFATGVAINGLIIVLFVLFASEQFVDFYFHKYIYLIVFVLNFLIFWPFYSKRMKHSSSWSKYWPFN